MILAIAREMAAMRERNIMDAWRNGGTFEGKRVSDDMVLDFWKSRMEGVSQKDPLYDQYKNTHEQLDFGINESKQRLLYDQGKLSATAMAQFYLNWAKKIPRDSEFWRTLQTRATQFIQTVRGRARSGRAAATKSAYDSAQSTTARSLEPGNIVSETLLNLAIVNTLVDRTDKDLSKMNDPAALQAILDRMNSNPDDIIYFKDGAPVTSGDVFAALSAADPNFVAPFSKAPTLNAATGFTSTPSSGGGMTTDYIIGALGQSHAINLNLADRARNAGKKTDTNKYVKAAGVVSEMAREAKLWGIAPAYKMIVESRDRVLNSSGVSTIEKLVALNEASRSLRALAFTPGLDARTITTLSQESDANAGRTGASGSATFGEDYLGGRAAEGVFDTTSDDDESPGDNVRLFTLWSQLNGEVVALSTDPDSFTLTFGKRDPKTGEFEFDPDGTEIGVVPQTDVARGAVEYDEVLIEQTDGPPLLVTAVGREVRAVARDRLGKTIPTGEVVPGGNADGSDSYLPSDNVLAIEYQYMDGGVLKRTYVLPDGRRTTEPPWAEGAIEYDNPNGTITVDVTALVTRGEDGSSPVAYMPNAVAIDAIRNTEQWDPDIDFGSMIAANVRQSDNPRALAMAVLKDPYLQASLQAQQADVADVQFDEVGNVISGDATKYYMLKNRENQFLQGSAGIAVPESPEHLAADVWSLGAKGVADMARAKVEAERSDSAFGTAEGSRQRAMGITIRTPIELSVPSYRSPDREDDQRPSYVPPPAVPQPLPAPRGATPTAYVPPAKPAAVVTPPPTPTSLTHPGTGPGDRPVINPYVKPVSAPDRVSGPGYSGTR